MKLEIGENNQFEVRQVQCKIPTGGSFSILYLSDLHLKRSSDGLITAILQKIEELNPSIILLGGDYIDFSFQLPKLERLLKELSIRNNVFAIAGNHDYRFGVKVIKACMERNNVQWLENKTVCITINDCIIQLDGTKPGKRNPAVDFAILCLHQPIDICSFHKQYDIAFAGHLHGCQFVFWKRGQRLYPGKFFFKWNVLQYTFENCNYYISKGMGDTIPVRYNCCKDMIFVKVAADNQ